MSGMLDQVRHCTSTSARIGNQHQLGGHMLVNYDGKGIVTLQGHANIVKGQGNEI